MNGKVEPLTREKPKSRAWLWIVLGLVVAIVGWVLKLGWDVGEFQSLKPHFSGTVQTIDKIVGGEDITIDRENNVALISADDRVARTSGDKDAVGAFYSLDVNDPNSKPVLIVRDPDEPIAPHGISLIALPGGRRLLYAVDHYSSDPNKRQNRILLYEFTDDARLKLLQTFSNAPEIISPNDVAGIDENRFYFTNDHGSADATGRAIEDYLRLAKSNVVYFDGDSYRTVASGLAYANGIALSSDGMKVYVAATIDQAIHVYDRNPADGSLTASQRIDMKTGVDNIELDEAGNLWVGCHPKLLTFVRHSQDTRRLAPSQVYKISQDGSGVWSREEVLLDDGSQLSASSVAAVSGNVLLIGPVFDRKILRCELKNQP